MGGEDLDGGEMVMTDAFHDVHVLEFGIGLGLGLFRVISHLVVSFDSGGVQGVWKENFGQRKVIISTQ